MPDEQTTPEQGGTKSEEAPTADSSNEASASRRKPSSGRSLGWWAVCFVLVVLVLIIGGYGYLLYVNLNPDSGPDGFQVRRVASTASNYLSSDPSVTSAEATGAEANINGSSVTVDAHLKDGTSVERPPTYWPQPGRKHSNRSPTTQAISSFRCPGPSRAAPSTSMSPVNETLRQSGPT